MAAHTLTICKQMLKQIEDARYVSMPFPWDYLAGAMNAPGWDSSLNILDHEYEEIARCIREKDTFAVEQYLWQAVNKCEPTHKPFATYEEFRRAQETFVRYGKPHWKRRAALWRAGLAPMPTEANAPYYRAEDR